MIRWLAVLCLACGINARAGEPEGNQPPPAASGSFRLSWDESRNGWTLHAADSRLDELAAAIGKATRCEVEVHTRLSDQRLTLTLSARPSESLYRTLARRASARLSVRYRLEAFPSGGVRRKGSLVFARQPVELDVREPAELSVVLEKLAQPLEVEEGVKGRARVLAVRHPLAAVLDQIADQVGARWTTVIRLEPRTFPDREAEEFERMHGHYQELVELSPQQRREELEADLAALAKLSPESRAARMGVLTRDIRSLGELLKTVPGEHRGIVGPRILAVAQDYWNVLSRLPPDRRTLFRPAVDALETLRRDVAQIR